jgi:hypothetical protein
MMSDDHTTGDPHPAAPAAAATVAGIPSKPTETLARQIIVLLIVPRFIRAACVLEQEFRHVPTDLPRSTERPTHGIMSRNLP